MNNFKRIVIAFLLTIVASINVYAKQYNFKTDFGAKGDGISDDSRAWSEAIAELDKNKTGTLFIPAGTYLIGEQTKLKNGNIQHKYENTIKQGINILIEGERNRSGKILSIIKFKDGLKHGIFNGKNASLGVAIRFENGNNITLRNLEFNGNLPKLNLGAKNAKQDLWHIGIYMNLASNVLIEDVKTNHFAMDGIYLRAPNKQGVNVNIVNVNSEYNARQGLSITSGRGVNILNSNFRYTGQGRLMVSPGANIDIENHSSQPIRDITIDGCLLSNNSSGSGSLTIAGNVENLKVLNTTIETESLYSIQSNYSQSKSFVFENCQITGVVEMAWGAKTKNGIGKTQFINCIFTDNNNSREASQRRALLNVMDDVELINCNFYLGNSRRLLHSYNNGSEKKNNVVLLKSPRVYNLNTKKEIIDFRKKISTPNRVQIK